MPATRTRLVIGLIGGAVGGGAFFGALEWWWNDVTPGRALAEGALFGPFIVTFVLLWTWWRGRDRDHGEPS
jgi:hypothetical protein